MTARPFVLAVLLAVPASSVALAQGNGGFQRWPTPSGGETPTQSAPAGGGGRERETQPRNAQPRTAPPETRTNSPRESTPRQAPPQATRERERERERDRERQAAPRAAVPRQSVPGNARDNNRRVDRGRPPVYVVRQPAYRYTPRFYRPYTYGAFGPGYFYYGNYGWYPRATYLYDLGYYGRGIGNAFGEVRLRVEPRQAEVYVDGFFAGNVDDFDGIFQSLRLESGPYHLEIVAPGYEPLEVDVFVNPGQKLTYRGVLRREF